MTNQLVSVNKSYRGEPVFVSSSEEFDKVSTHHLVLYNCKNCGVSAQVIKDSRYKDHQRNLLCRQCNLSLTCSRKNGLDKVASPDEPIFISTETDFDKIRNGRMIKFYCKNCGELYSTRVKADRRQRLRRMLCFKCQCVDTSKKHYGTDYPMQNKDVLSRCHKKYNYNGMSFDSSWELAFWIYHKDYGINIIRDIDGIDYVFNGEHHKYFPDFNVNGTLFEIKGNHFLNDDGTMKDPYKDRDGIFEAKRQCALAHNVVFIKEQEIKPYIDYVNTKYGKEYLQSFRNK